MHPRLTTATWLACLIVYPLALTGPAESTWADSNPDTPPESAAKKGAQIYQQKCASCHGADGQGAPDGEGYDEPLAGDGTIASLAQVIEQTMPEEDPEDCVGQEARQVAQYIYYEFYSLAARRRKGLAELPRIELTRLTVTQHQNALADLVAHFTPEVPQDRDDEPGLYGEYFQSRGMSKADSRRSARVDRRISFDFGAGSPHAEISADQFTVVWVGSLHARHTGHHEFRIESENGARLYINHDAPEIRERLRDDSSVTGQDALIDAWVSVGALRQESARVFLLGGRTYPIRLEFFKYKEKSASIKLEWRQPEGVWSVLDHNHLRTKRSPRTFVAQTPFPADDRSLGYERGISISNQWHAATNQAAIETAGEVIDRLPLLAGTIDDSTQHPEKLRQFAKQFAAAAYRRPLADDEAEVIDALFQQYSNNPEAAARRAILLILKSPHFLYTNLHDVLTGDSDQGRDHSTTAAALALALWDSIPSGELIKRAADGKLTSEDQIEKAAREMLRDQRAKGKMAGFFRHWLEIEYRDLAKDKELFPEFDEQVIADLRYSLEVFLEQVVWSRQSDYRKLLQADFLVLNDRLLNIYQQQPIDKLSTAPGVTDFRQFVFADQKRAGVLTHPYLLSAFAYHNNTSPIHRGVFLTRNIVGRALKPPTEAVAFKDDEFSPDLTMRQKITQLTRESACMACHSVINPLGFALENFDPVGRWRTIDNDKPVNTKARYVTASGDTIEFANAVDIANYAVESEDAHRAFVTQVFRHMIRQDPAAYGAETLDGLTKAFEEDDFNIQNLLVRIAVLVASHDPGQSTGQVDGEQVAAAAQVASDEQVAAADRSNEDPTGE